MRLQTLQPASKERCVAMMKTYLEHIARNSSKLGIPCGGLELLQNRLFSASAGCFPGWKEPSVFISFNMSKSDTRRFVHNPGEDEMSQVTQGRAAMLDTTFVVLASTSKREVKLAAGKYAEWILRACGVLPELAQGENIIVEDGFAGIKETRAQKSVVLFTKVITFPQ